MCPVSALASLVEHTVWQSQHLFSCVYRTSVQEISLRVLYKYIYSLHITVCISSYVICIHFTDLYHFCPVFYWPGHVGPGMEGAVCSNNTLTPLPVYMQVQTRSSFPHFPAHEPLPLLPIKRVHRGATRPLLGGKLGLTVWTGHSAPGFILFLTPRWNLTWKHRNYLK